MLGTDEATRASALGHLVEALRARKRELVDDGMQRIRNEILGYVKVKDEKLITDVREHIDEHFDEILRAIARGRPLERDDLAFMRPHVSRRVGRIPLTDFMHAFRIYNEVLWEAMLDNATDEETRHAVLSAGGILLRYINTAAAEAAEIYLEAERLVQAHGEQVRRDLLEDLVGGKPPDAGPKLTAARDAGLEPPVACVLIAAVPVSPPSDEHVLRSAAVALARAVGSVLPPLTVIRQGEVVIIAPARGDVRAAVDALAAAQGKLAAGGMTLALGISTIHEDLRRMDDAYAEAASALERVRATGGVVALPILSAFDCLALFGQETARRRIPTAVKQFVADDLSEGRVLTDTLLEYVGSDFNTKLAAERLHLHTNTARYRLGKIEERTGCDLRRVSDVLDLLIAVRVAEQAVAPAD